MEADESLIRGNPLYRGQFADLKEKYDILRVIHTSANSNVYEAVEKQTQQKKAIKKIDSPYSQLTRIKQIKEELIALSQIKEEHQNIISCEGFFLEKECDKLLPT